MGEKIIKVTDEMYDKIKKTEGITIAEEIDIAKSWVPKTRFNELNDKLKTTDEKIGTYEKQLEDTKKLLASSEEYKSKYDDLDKKYKDDLALKDKEISNTKKKFLAENILIKEGAKHTNLLLNQLDFDKLSIEGDNLLGIKDFVDGFKKDYSDLFSVTKNKGNNNNNNGNDGKNEDTEPGEENWEELLKDL